MTKAEEKKIETWGTWEELLLACAVNRYGTKNWDSIAMEIQSRSSSSPHLISSENCKAKYYDLQSRFTKKSVKIDEDESETDHTKDKTIPWLDELRKLRVAELRREVERYDVSIVSLQLKVKRLRDEREQSLKEEEKPDLRKKIEAGDDEPDKTEPENVVRKPVSNQSFNESNSTDLKGDNRKIGEQVTDKKPDPIEPVVLKPDPVHREACDAQSSASLSRKKSCEKSGSRSSSGDEPETETNEVFPANDRNYKRCEPLLSFLEIIRSHKYGSVFERRLKSQETEKYRSIIRQHVDLKTVKTRLRQGRYSGCRRKFFRDLLLLFNNAIVFFPKQSPESIAAIELRKLVSKQIKTRIRKPDPPPEKLTVQQTVRNDPESSDSLLLKPKPSSSVPLITCRKRSSIERKGDKKPDHDRKIFEDQIVVKKRTRERPASTTGGTNRNNNNNNNNNSSKNSNQNDNLKMRSEKKTATLSVEKKQSAAKFLSRIKRNSSSRNGGGTSLNKRSGSENNNSSNNRNRGEAEGPKEKKNISKGEDRRDQISRKTYSVKQAVEESSPSKRSVGRPPKRAAAPPPALEAVGLRQSRKRARK